MTDLNKLIGTAAETYHLNSATAINDNGQIVENLGVLNQRDERLMACYLHIGLDHLAYNAHLGDMSALWATAERLQALVR